MDLALVAHVKPARARDAAPDREAVARLFHENVRYVFRALRHLGVRDRDADDVCQEVFVTAQRRLPDFEPRASERAWLYGIAVRLAAAYRRKAHHRRESLDGETADAAEQASAPEAVDARRELTRLAALLDELDDDERAAFVLVEIEGLPMKDVATTLGCALPTAYAWHRQARETLRAKLAAAHGESR